MAECQVANFDNFVNTGRTGRRNALPDIMAPGHLQVSAAGLPEEMENFSLNSTPNGTAEDAQAQAEPPKDTG